MIINSNTSDSSRFYKVSRIHIQSEFGPSSVEENPPVLLELSADIHFDERVQPVCLASNDHLLLFPPHNHSRVSWVAGWGSGASSQSTNDWNITQLPLRWVRAKYVEHHTYDQSHREYRSRRDSNHTVLAKQV